ncbi:MULTISPECIES: hypothetical protein [unclassified Bartonella]|uniref:hypothetical protein n=1 Tax=unclassified Bartonella TaxID=2645622 RepID=UPI0035D0D721
MEKYKEATKSFFREAWQIANSWFDIFVYWMISSLVLWPEGSFLLDHFVKILCFYIKGDICIIFFNIDAKSFGIQIFLDVEEVDSVALL